MPTILELDLGNFWCTCDEAKETRLGRKRDDWWSLIILALNTTLFTGHEQAIYINLFVALDYLDLLGFLTQCYAMLRYSYHMISFSSAASCPAISAQSGLR